MSEPSWRGILGSALIVLAVLLVRWVFSQRAEPSPRHPSWTETSEGFESISSRVPPQRRPLDELGEALAPFVEAEAWGDPIDIVLPVQENFAQLILQRDGVDLYSNGIEVDLDRFRRAAADLSLELHSLTGGIQVEPAVPSEPQLFVEIRHDWPAVAEAVIHMIRVIYGTDGRDEVEVRFT